MFITKIKKYVLRIWDTDNNFKLDGKSSGELVVVCMSMLSAPVLAELYSFSYGGFGYSQTY